MTHNYRVVLFCELTELCVNLVFDFIIYIKLSTTRPADGMISGIVGLLITALLHLFLTHMETLSAWLWLLALIKGLHIRPLLFSSLERCY